MEIDGKAWALLQAIQQDGRLSLTELAARVGLSVPATSERLKRLEEAGVIRGYRAVVDPVAVGYGVQALIGMTTPQPGKQKLLAKLREMPEVIECVHVTGQDSYMLRVVTRDIAHLEALVGAINHFGETRTSIVMSTPIPLRPLSPPVK
ncbi:Lrp/AsnC family transcriptional regulator [Crenobacter caeni]|uniref:Lrp/AsnC family transcriptional regulator n=1 Tax=Crenobacter caeni TaxID=2705474 RepID=A0A6B2KUW1_9NEIS|nr:Lrp/AsnC family transcriptional regulator [Crenobacter caeni]NDV13840.1 Lrp/AsnC family transcriptional regulator [Crenobacter caeni]